jgi:hypothetical protein
MLGQAQVLRGLGGQHQLVDRPFRARLRIAAHLRGGEAVKRLVIGRMDRDQLALQMGRELGDLDAVLGGGRLHVVAVALGFGRFLEIEQPSVPAWHLYALEAEAGGPLANRVQGIVRRRVAGILRKKDRRPFDGRHRHGMLLPIEAAARSRAASAGW